MSLVIRVLIGFALAAGGLTFLVYGITQAIEVGSCGTDEYGNSVGPPCPRLCRSADRSQPRRPGAS